MRNASELTGSALLREVTGRYVRDQSAYPRWSIDQTDDTSECTRSRACNLGKTVRCALSQESASTSERPRRNG